MDFSCCSSISECFHPEHLNEKYIYFAFLIFVVLMTVGKRKKRLLYLFIYSHLPTEKKKQKTKNQKPNNPGFLKWKFQRGIFQQKPIPLFSLALLQTNVQSHPSPASTDTYAWFQKGWRSCVLKGVTLRHAIKHIQKSEQDQKLEQLHPGIPLGPNFIIFTSIY